MLTVGGTFCFKLEVHIKKYRAQWVKDLWKSLFNFINPKDRTGVCDSVVTSLTGRHQVAQPIDLNGLVGGCGECMWDTDIDTMTSAGN